MQDGTGENFEGHFRDECLNEHWFRGARKPERVTEA
jgi:hypothetical protein